MLSKCANPECSASFRYFHTGKLFRADITTGLERRRTLDQDEHRDKPLRRLEFFWLCEGCAQSMTISFDKETGVKVRHKEYARSAATA
jgi:hypothetical protein